MPGLEGPQVAVDQQDDRQDSEGPHRDDQRIPEEEQDQAGYPDQDKADVCPRRSRLASRPLAVSPRSGRARRPPGRPASPGRRLSGGLGSMGAGITTGAWAGDSSCRPGKPRMRCHTPAFLGGDSFRPGILPRTLHSEATGWGLAHYSSGRGDYRPFSRRKTQPFGRCAPDSAFTSHFHA